MNAWCHGAPGIGLSRLRAFELLKKEEYADAARVAIQTTLEAESKLKNNCEEVAARSYTLCHGSGGNAELFLEAYKIFGNEKYLLLAEKVALQTLAHGKMNHGYISGYGRAGTQKDLSLFMGKAGVGYFYLRVFAQENRTKDISANDFCIGKAVAASDDQLF
ncbi:MAG: lanthionine synthetase LanC family protein [bacterium]